MFKKMSVYLLGLAILCANAQTINLQGVISNSGGKPIANAVVSLVRQKMMDTTGTDGKFSFIGTSVKKLLAIVPQTNDISLNNDVLQFTLSASSPMKVEIFNLKGYLLRQEINMSAPAGTYRFDLAKNCQAANVLVVKAAIGRSELSFRYMPLNGGRHALSLPNAASTISNSGGLAALAAVVDTITVTATGFQTKTVAITSYDNQQQNISLDSSNGKNPPGPSIGCGKTLGSINKSGTYTITSSNVNRTYIINIPTNYDKNKPYPLIFGMHCMGGSAIKVAGTDNGQDQSAFWYHVKPLADKDSIYCIYVAPQGNGDGTWQGEPDRKFFSDMVNLFKDTLCIDTTRVFSIGFSFGAMFTYTLSLEFPKVLRAVACYAPANYNMDQPTNQHLPINYFQTTGISDDMCPWIHDSTATPKTGGKFCLLEHIQDNGCTVPSTIPLATSGTHVTTYFQGCKEGYFTKFCSFQGVHQCTASDAGSSTNWIPVETWEFLKRF